MTKSIDMVSVGRKAGIGLVRVGRFGALVTALEPRMMFDGAAVVDVAHAAADAAAKALIPNVAAAVTVRDSDPSKDGGKKEVAFVDVSVANYKALEVGIREGVAIVEIGGGNDGLAQMAKWAEANSGFDAIHVLSHGAEGKLFLGSTALTDAALAQAVTGVELAEIGHALKDGGDLLIYGCDVAKGADGQAFIVDLAASTGVKVAASADATGWAGAGGNWALEYSAGAINASPLSVDGYGYLLTTLTFSGASDGAVSIDQMVPADIGTATLTFSDDASYL